MKLLSCHDGKLHVLSEQHLHRPPGGVDGGADGGAVADGSAFTTGLAALDGIAPGGAFARGAVHEILSDRQDGTPLFFAMLLASRGSCGSCGSCGTGFQPVSEDPIETGHGQDARATGAIVWCDPHGTLYPPALAAHGVPPRRLFLLRPPAPDRPLSPAEVVWAAAECLRCRGVGAVVATLPPGQRLTRVEARRLQLSAERGGGVGLLLRPSDGTKSGGASGDHAAATRWLVTPHPGERAIQRWKIQLVHGHGGRVGEAVILEHNRERRTVQAHPLHRAARLGDRPRTPEAAPRSA
jgi:hypothetical protein